MASQDGLAQVLGDRDACDAAIGPVEIVERLPGAGEVRELLERRLERPRPLSEIGDVAAVRPEAELAALHRVEELLERVDALGPVVSLRLGVPNDDEPLGVIELTRLDVAYTTRSAALRRRRPLTSIWIETSRAICSRGKRYSSASTRIVRWTISSCSVHFAPPREEIDDDVFTELGLGAVVLASTGMPSASTTSVNSSRLVATRPAPRC